jgi:hypothetical protein
VVKGYLVVPQSSNRVVACANSICKNQLIMLFEEINRLRQIDRLIRLNNTGNAQEFAKKLNLSRRQVYNIIESLKDVGLEIEYNRNISSFVYAKPYKINITFEITELPENEAIEINAGRIIIKNNFFDNNNATTVVYRFCSE